MVRLQWLETAGGKDLMKGLARFEGKESPSRADLAKALEASGDAMARYFEEFAAGTRKSATLKKGVGGLFAYLIAHEAHHRGSMLLTIKQAGFPLDDALKWGIWEWSKL
jgi:uncharacterized damage-inducible protein DinB